MSEAYYNEHDPKAAAWLRELIRGGHIALGVVDERSIEDVSPAELVRFTQCHFFAGIGVWSYALRRAGWPDDRPIWTGSCPCQPFSAAGKGDGFADERHLWPAFYHLIRECNPECVTGEQVASKDADSWIDLVQADMEALEYAFGAVPFPAAGVGAPEIRDRLYWVANDQSQRCGKERPDGTGQHGRDCAQGLAAGLESGGLPSWLADSNGGDAGAERKQHGREQRQFTQDGGDSLVGGDIPGPTNGHWRAADWILCRDPDGPRWRPVEPGTFPLAHGAPERMGRLRGYGNAIVAQAAEEFIKAVMESV